MKNSSMNHIFLIVLLVLTGVLVYQVFKPFLLVLILAFILAHFFRSWYKWLSKKLKGRNSLASFLTCVLVFLVFVIPFALIVGLAAKETIVLVSKVGSVEWRAQLESFLSTPDLSFISEGFNLHSFVMSDKVLGGLQDVGQWTLSIAKGIYEGTANFFFMVFVLFFSLYYFFKDGERMTKRIMDLIPLKNDEERVLIENFVQMSRATLKGTLVIAAVQGILTGILFWAVGISEAAFWGLATAFFSIIPLAGAGIVWAPTGLILIFSGSVVKGIIVLLAGGLVISMVDNFLRPKLVGNDTRLHPLLVFFATIGGILVFGFLGFLVGPVLVAFFVALLDIYRKEFKVALKKFNGE